MEKSKQITIMPLVEGLAGHQDKWIDVETRNGDVFRLPVYEMADERYISCGAVIYYKRSGRTPGVYCREHTSPPPNCSLAGRGRLCAFCDPDFDWDRIGDNVTIWPMWSYESLENLRWFKAGYTEPPEGGHNGA